MARPKLSIPEPNPSGLCMCGCGRKTNLAKQSDSKLGLAIGKPLKYCAGHYQLKSLVEYIEEDRGYKTPCWIWQRAINAHGYGNVRVNGKYTSAYRMMYERICGPVPEGLELDHLCRVRACVNPDHLEPVTPLENQRRGIGLNGRMRKLACKRGHLRTPENGHIDAKGSWHCRTCNTLYARDRREARRKAA